MISFLKEDSVVLPTALLDQPVQPKAIKLLSNYFIIK
jgi:hypothetical protein